ncbi:MAG: hypothetical protein ACK40G_08500 [Cytophagaceae bacterium]
MCNRNIFYLAFFFLIGILTSCEKPPKYPDTPQIEFKKIEKMTYFSDIYQSNIDSLIISITFKDGDGDLGLEPPYSTSYNFKAEALMKGIDGNFYTIFDADNSFASGYFPPLRPSGKKGPIEGTLSKGTVITPSDYQIYNIPPKSKLKFKITIKDKAERYSNTVETDEIELN